MRPQEHSDDLRPHEVPLQSSVVKTYSDQVKLYWAWTIQDVPSGTYTLRLVARKDTADNEPCSITLTHGSTTAWSHCSQTVTVNTTGPVQFQVSDAPGWEYDKATSVSFDCIALEQQ